MTDKRIRSGNFNLSDSPIYNNCISFRTLHPTILQCVSGDFRMVLCYDYVQPGMAV